jgi:hypothetical protein
MSYVSSTQTRTLGGFGLLVAMVGVCVGFSINSIYFARAFGSTLGGWLLPRVSAHGSFVAFF